MSTHLLGGLDHDISRGVYPENSNEEVIFCDMKGCWNPAVENDKFCRKCLGEDE